MIAKGKLTKIGGQYNYKGTELGADSRTVTNTLIKTDELSDLREEIMLT